MAKTIQQIKNELENAGEGEIPDLLYIYGQDDRKGVVSLVARYRRDIEKLKQERIRLDKMRFFEDKYSDRYKNIAGIDEAGRGPLAGPVVAGAVILPRDCEILYLNDSKQVNKNKREELFDEIKEKAVAYGVGIASPEIIDKINILQATYRAMGEAVSNMQVMPDCLLVDAVTIPGMACKQVGIVKGDEKSLSIAAASIIAKVTRDRMMTEFDKIYPEYGFASHKGYGSKAHIEAIKKHGPCPIHRATFIKNFI